MRRQFPGPDTVAAHILRILREADVPLTPLQIAHFVYDQQRRDKLKSANRQVAAILCYMRKRGVPIEHKWGVGYWLAQPTDGQVRAEPGNVGSESYPA